MPINFKNKNISVFFLLLILAILSVAGGINRKMPFGILRYDFIDIMKVTDLFGMLFLAPSTLICLFCIFHIYDGMKSKLLSILFILGAFFLGAGFGMHDPFNIFQRRYSGQLPLDIIRSMEFLDDGLGHWLFFAGFALVSLSVCFAELRNQAEENMPAFFVICISLAGLAVAVAICLNMIHEETLQDILVLFSVTAAVFSYHLKKRLLPLKRLPAVMMVYSSYGGGALLTVSYWIAKIIF